MKQAEKHAELSMGRNDTDGNTLGGASRSDDGCDRWCNPGIKGGGDAVRHHAGRHDSVDRGTGDRGPLRVGGPAGRKNGANTHLPFSRAGPGRRGKEADKRQYDCQYLWFELGCDTIRTKSNGGTGKAKGATRKGGA